MVSSLSQLECWTMHHTFLASPLELETTWLWIIAIAIVTRTAIAGEQAILTEAERLS